MQKSAVNFKYTILILLIVFLGIACTNAKQEQEPEKINQVTQQAFFTIPDNLKPGVLYPKITINNDELNSFALYLPKLYNKHTLWPAVFFFDPKGKGNLPVSKYQSLADSLGYILIGSNVSKNGQQIDEAMEIWQTLKNSSLKNISIDPNRLVLAGFSGGARVCCAIASGDRSITGIIANSAGAPSLEEILSEHMFFIGMTGNGDMNRAEMLNIEQHLSGTTLSHFYLEFNGTHEWAPLQTMQKALMLASLNSYLKKAIHEDSQLINQFISNQQNEIEKLKSEGKWTEAYNELLVLTKGVSGLNSMPIENIDSLKNNPTYVVQKTALLQLNAIETEIQQELYKIMLNEPNQMIWEKKITEIRKKANLNTQTGQMYERLLGYASLVCYSLSNRNLVSKNYAAAQITVNCYEIADPENAEVYFFKAIIFGAKSDKQNTLLNLEKAKKLGMNDVSRINKQMEFDFLKNDAAFLKTQN